MLIILRPILKIQILGLDERSEVLGPDRPLPGEGSRARVWQERRPLGVG